MKTAFYVVLQFFCLPVFGEQPTTAPSTPAAETTKEFLSMIDQGQADRAITHLDSKTVDDKLKERIGKMSKKLASLGRIKRVDVGPCEQRRIDAHEKKTGERIDVVPVEIICGSEDLLLVVFSTRKVEGKDKIFMIESLKEWGGTASLDEEMGYQH